MRLERPTSSRTCSQCRHFVTCMIRQRLRFALAALDLLSVFLHSYWTLSARFKNRRQYHPPMTKMKKGKNELLQNWEELSYPPPRFQKLYATSTKTFCVSWQHCRAYYTFLQICLELGRAYLECRLYQCCSIFCWLVVKQKHFFFISLSQAQQNFASSENVTWLFQSKLYAQSGAEFRSRDSSCNKELCPSGVNCDRSMLWQSWNSRSMPAGTVASKRYWMRGRPPMHQYDHGIVAEGICSMAYQEKDYSEKRAKRIF